MTSVIAELCVDVKHRFCIDVCLVPERPAEASFPEDALPGKGAPMVWINAAWLEGGQPVVAAALADGHG